MERSIKTTAFSWHYCISFHTALITITDMPSDNKTVLVSGVSGFVGSWVALTFLERGWQTRGTVRSQSKVDILKQSSPKLKKYIDEGKFEIFIVEDVITGDFSKALEGCDTFAHTASPFATSGSNNEEDFLKPALNGTQNALRAAKKAGIKNFVVTSSFASNLDMSDDKMPLNGKTYNEKDWNPFTYEFAAKSDVPVIGYATSKVVAERACWDFQKQEGLEGKMSIASICPPMIFGPFIHQSDASKLGESLGQVRDLVNGTAKEIPPTGFPVYADVRDVALAHVLSAEKGANARYCIYNGQFDNEWVADFAHKDFSEQASKYGVPKSDSGKDRLLGNDKLLKIDTTKSRQELGLKYDHSMEQTFHDMIADIYKAM